MKWNKSDILALMVGHGKSLDGSWDSGCIYGNYTEAGLMLSIVKVAVKWLRKSGVKVITDADDANNRNMKASVAWANSKNARVYMSVHCDYSKAPKGVAPLYKSEAGRIMATTIGKSIAKDMKMTWRGAFKRNDLYELNATKMTAVILETGSIKGDLKSLKDYKKYGKALAKGICKYIGVKLYSGKGAKVIKAVKAVVIKEKKLKFKYQVSGNATSWKSALKQRTTNCSRTQSYGLQVANVLKSGQYFWLNGDGVICRGPNCRKQLLAAYDVLHPHKTTAQLAKSKYLKKGDIVGYGNPAHTMMFAGYTKTGKPKFYSTGNQKEINKGRAQVISKYNKRTIYTVLRLK